MAKKSEKAEVEEMAAIVLAEITFQMHKAMAITLEAIIETHPDKKALAAAFEFFVKKWEHIDRDQPAKYKQGMEKRIGSWRRVIAQATRPLSS